jgi:hypothetical protein
MSSQGYVLIAVGQRYIDEVACLISTLRKQNDLRPITVIIDPDDVGYFVEKNTGASYTELRDVNGNFDLFLTDFERKGTYPKVSLFDFTVYDETIFLDSDVLCQYDTSKVWNFMGTQPQHIAMVGKKYDPHWAAGEIESVIQKIGKHISHTHGGFVYFRKPQAKLMYDYFVETVVNYNRWCGQRHYKNSMPDEMLYAMVFSKFDYWPLEFDEFPIMTFNADPDGEFPSKLQTNIGKELDDFIPFIHMYNRSSHGRVYNMIMEKE